MLEMLLNPKMAERKPWTMFFVGLFYGLISVLLVNVFFSNNPVFSKYSSLLVIMFTVMLSLPFVYFTIRLEKEKGYREEGFFFKSHGRALMSLIWLFIGFVVAFSLMYILFPGVVGNSFDAQIEQYCLINAPTQTQECVSKYVGMAQNGITGSAMSGFSASKDYAMDILVNNIYVLIFCLLFSLLFGAGAIFILAWNASVIATAIWIFSKSSIENFPIAFSRYMIHGIPEIAAYFTAALAGGIISIALIRHDFNDKRFWDTIRDSLNLIVLAVLLIIFSAGFEAFITPRIF
ncbi:MAG: stage II sporulation protein M [Nanoarchaeota archaeon]|nr:stage II sporulation protein M [Nanoarchaeota archaeon]